MKRRSVPPLRCALPLLALAALVMPVSAQAPERLISFQLEDQFERPYDDQSWAGRGLVLVGSDRHARQYNPLWADALRASLEKEGLADGFAFVGLADMRGVPGFLRGTIKKKFPDDESAWVLLDWKGVFAETYGFVKRHSNTLVFAADGRLLFQLHGLDVDPSKVEAAVAAVLQTQPVED